MGLVRILRQWQVRRQEQWNRDLEVVRSQCETVGLNFGEAQKVAHDHLAWILDEGSFEGDEYEDEEDIADKDVARYMIKLSKSGGLVKLLKPVVDRRKMEGGNNAGPRD